MSTFFITSLFVTKVIIFEGKFSFQFKIANDCLLQKHVLYFFYRYVKGVHQWSLFFPTNYNVNWYHYFFITFFPTNYNVNWYRYFFIMFFPTNYNDNWHRYFFILLAKSKGIKMLLRIWVTASFYLLKCNYSTWKPPPCPPHSRRREPRPTVPEPANSSRRGSTTVKETTSTTLITKYYKRSGVNLLFRYF